MSADPGSTAVVLIEFQHDFTSDGGALHGAVEEVMESTDMMEHTKQLRRRGARGRRDHHPRADQLRRGLPRDHRSPVRDPVGGRRQQGVRQGIVGRRHRRRPRAAAGRHRHRGQAGAGHLREHEPRLHPAEQGHQDGRARRLPHELLRRVDHASAYEKGYDVVTLTDCVAATSQAEHDNAIQYDYPMFSRPMTSTEFAGTLQGKEAAESSRGY